MESSQFDSNGCRCHGGNQSPTIGKLMEALSKAQGAMRPALKDSENPYFKSKYADLKRIWESVREPLAQNGLAVVQTTRIDPNGRVVVVTTLGHSSGEWIRGELAMMPVKQGPHEVGSTITYARRYALAAIVGAVTEDEDDDGNAGAGRPAEPLADAPAAPVHVHSEEPTVEDRQPEAVPRITKAMQAYIEQQLKRKKIDLQTFLNKVGVASLSDIPMSEKDRVILMLRREA